jgi:hypothetical protein
MQLAKQTFLTAIFAMMIANTIAQNKGWIKLKEETIKISAIGQFNIQLLSLIHDSTVFFEHVEVDSRPVFVRYEGRYDKAFENAFIVSKFSHGSKIEMKINLDSIKASGSYVGALRFNYKQEGKKLKTCDVDFTLVRPAAKLESPETIKMTISGGEVEYSTAFSILETGGISDVRNLKLISPDISGVSLANVIEFKPSAVIIPANTKAQIEYGLRQGASDNLPLGKLSGRMHITSPELPNPLVVSWEIINRCHPSVIFFLILGGAVLGAVVRNLLVPAKVVLESRIKATNQLQIMHAYIKNNVNDSLWSARFTICAEKLSDVIINRYVVSNAHRENIEAAIVSVTTEFKELQTEFTGFIAATTTRLTKLRVLFEMDVKINEPKFAGCKEMFNKAKDHFAARQITLADQACDLTERSLSDFANQYSKRLKVLSALLTHDRLIPAFIPPGEKIAFQTWLDEVKSQLLFQNFESVEDVKKFIPAAEAFKANMEKLANTLIGAVSGIVSGSGPTIVKAFDDWKLRMTNYFLDETLEEADHFVRLEKSKVSMEKALGAVSNSLATTQAGARNVRQNRNPGNIDSGLITQRQTPKDPGTKPGVPSYIDMAKQDKFAFWKANALQLIIVSGVMAVASYGLYYKDFIGTVPEMISIFVFAFGLDITLESIKTISGKKVS